MARFGCNELLIIKSKIATTVVIPINFRLISRKTIIDIIRCDMRNGFNQYLGRRRHNWNVYRKKAFYILGLYDNGRSVIKLSGSHDFDPTELIWCYDRIKVNCNNTYICMTPDSLYQINIIYKKFELRVKATLSYDYKKQIGNADIKVNDKIYYTTHDTTTFHLQLDHWYWFWNWIEVTKKILN